MKVNGKAHCLFEQSGAFKNEFIKLGIMALDYDIQNNFAQTDIVIDLFAEIDKAYGGGKAFLTILVVRILSLPFIHVFIFVQRVRWHLVLVTQITGV